MWAGIVSSVLGLLVEFLRFLALRGRVDRAEANIQSSEDARKARQQAEGSPKNEGVDENDPFLRD